MNDNITLTFDGVNENKVDINDIQEKKNIDSFDEASLTEQEQRMVEDFSQKIDLSNSQLVLEYGAGVQKKMSDFSDQTLSVIKTKDLDEIGGLISNLVIELKNFDVDSEEKGFFSFMKSAKKKKDLLQAKYNSVENNVDNIVNSLENQQVILMKDISMLDQMYDLNKNYYKEISMYILAGKKKLMNMNNIVLPAMKKNADESGNQSDIEKLNDLRNQKLRFEKKIHDLELSRTISIQTAPQIRMIQNTNMEMVEKIQSTIVNTIPLWKNQMVLALGVAHSTQAIKTQKEISDVTNQLLKKNADALKMATIESAKESERGIVDIETLQHTNQTLISSLDEVMKIQDEGRKKRADAEVQIRKLEEELKNKMMEIATK